MRLSSPVVNMLNSLKKHPDCQLGRDTFVGAALAAIGDVMNGVANAAKAAPTMTTPRGQRQIYFLEFVNSEVSF